MPRTETPSIPTAIATPLPALGQPVLVRVAPGLVLINNDTGQRFEADTPTPVTMTVTTLRRLADGDLVLAG